MSLPLTPYERWESGTNQNSVPANNNSLRDEIFNTDGIADDVTAQPGSPSDGDWYIIPAAATGAQWATFTIDSVAIFYGGTWYEFTPAEGSKLLIAGVLSIYSGSGGWEPITLPAAATWGAITGTLTDQTDLAAALALKQNRSPSIQSVASSATVTPTFADDMVKITAQAAALALANPTGTAIPGLGMVIRIKDNGTARAITYDTQYRAIGVTLPTTTVISKTLYLAMIFNDTDTKWDVVAVGQQA